MKTQSVMFLLLLLGVAPLLPAQHQDFTIRGSVTDENGAPLPYVNVFLMKSAYGAVTDEKGRFLITTHESGVFDLVASSVGYGRFTSTIDLTGDLDLAIALTALPVKGDEVVVTASSYGSEKGKGLVMSSMDVVTTPGGAADIYQSLKTLPGLTQVSESAELYVRGGDPIETVTLIDQASLYHPYTFESAFGGIFSSLNTSTVSSMFFSSGGFSVKYGNVLSGVLDIDTKDRVPLPRYSIGISIANAAVNAELPLNDSRTGLRLNGRHTFTRSLFWLNGGADRFTVTPVSRDLTATATHAYSETGRVKLVALLAGDEQGVNVDRPEFSGIFNGTSRNTLLNLQVKDILLTTVAAKSSISFNRYQSSWRFGVLDLARTDEIVKWRTDAAQPLSARLKLAYGWEAEKRSTAYRGIIPSNDYDVRSEAPGEYLDALLAGTRLGAYAEVELAGVPGIPGLFAVAGVRTDHIPSLGRTWYDPRGSIGWRLGDRSTVRFATGIFRQLPDARLFAQSDGNPDLGPMKAVHYVVSYDYAVEEGTDIRVELFHKQYLDLPLEHPTLHYDNGGRGYARGIDMVAKGNLGLLSGWVSYGFLDSKRQWMDYAGLAPSPYDITHNLAIVIKVNVSQAWQVGLTYKHATGKPFTEIIGADYHPGTRVYEPIQGTTNGSRYRPYRRLDLRLTHLTTLLGENGAAFYIEALNILNIENSFGYTYSPDYSERKDIRSYFGRRLVVIGVQLGL